ncbi:MAG TPA: hypothetical protein VL991_03685 [Terracidiphilus sp.]|nr:hypothetical protein [Terracidiphilus sp.]
MDSLRERIRSFLKVTLPTCSPDVRFIEREAEDGITRSLISYTAPDGDQIEAFLFQPEAAKPQAAVLALHQHNSQWLIGKSEIAGLAGDPLQAFGPALARHGVMVLAPDAVGFESRLSKAGWGSSLAPSSSKPHSTPEGWLQYYNQMAHRLVKGDLLLRKILEDSAAGLSALETLSGIRNLGVVGHSFGGNTTLFLAALDTRVIFSCASGSVCSFRHKLRSQTALEMSLIIPGFCNHFDFDDLLRCIAPRRLLVISSQEDPLSADAEDLVRAALPAFEQLNCVAHLQHVRTAAGHALDRERFNAIIDWCVARANCPS